MRTLFGGGPLRGTTTDDDAAAGFLGEFRFAQLLAASAVSITSTTTINIISLAGADPITGALTAGNWLVGAVAYMITGTNTSITRLRADISLTTGTNAASDTGASFQWATAANVPGAAVLSLVPPIRRVKVAAGATQDVFLVADPTFSADVMTGFGTIWAVRFR